MSITRNHPDLPNTRLFTPVQYVAGIGPLRAQLLARLGIHRAVDLIYFFPRTYEPVAALRSAAQFAENERVSFVGTIRELDQRVTQSGKHMLGAVAEIDGGGFTRLLWYNQPFRINELKIGQRIVATGTLRSTVLNWEMVQPQLVLLGDDELPESQKPLPIYPLTEGLRQSTVRKMIAEAIPTLLSDVEEVLPTEVCEQLDLLPIQDALKQLHWPSNLQSAEQARRRFISQELLVLQLAIALQRQARDSRAHAPCCEPNIKVHARILNRLGYILTRDQEQAIAEIGQDMSRSVPMNRLLQGDVGTGKTVVAQYAMLLGVAYGFQAALMVPTEVLAQQHERTLRRNLASSRVRIGLLTGSLSRAQRQTQLEQLAAGEIDLVIGTQALLSEHIAFKNLGLVVVDEQHRFGVEQRARLKQDAGLQPHYLVLSATPIPRTIAMTALGDLDVSVIRQRPPGRGEVKTYLGDSNSKESWWRFVDEQIAKGRQAYVIAPRVNDSATEEIESVEGVSQRLQAGPFAHRKLGVLHGRLASEQKESVLMQFASGDLDLLVATTVVEVGIDVPNATVMTILDADRLGLAQLHQLRGRVSRGSGLGYVCAFPSFGSDGDDNQRLAAFEKTNDGFELAELDLRLRGPGDLMGTRQHGLPPFRIADLSRDGAIVEQTRNMARKLVAQFPGLNHPSLQSLKRQVMIRYGHVLGLSDVG